MNVSDARLLRCAVSGTAILTLATIFLAFDVDAAKSYLPDSLYSEWAVYVLVLQVLGECVLLLSCGRPTTRRGWAWLIFLNGWLLGVAALYHERMILFALMRVADLLLRVGVAALWSVALLGLPATLFWIWRHRRAPRPQFRFGRWWFSTCVLLLTSEPLMAILDRDVERLRFPSALPDPPANELRIAFIGDSTMFGHPYDAKFGIPQVLAWRVEQMHRDWRVVTANLAVPGQNLRQAIDCLATLQFKPHLLVVYCGHNEFHHEYEELAGSNATYFGALDDVLCCSPTFRVLNTRMRQNLLLRELKSGSHRGFVDRAIASPAMQERRLLRFRNQLEQLARHGQSQEIGMLWYVPAASESGFEPNRSCVRPRTSPQEIDDLYEIARRAADRKHADDWSAAAELYRTGLRAQPEFADFHFGLGECLQRLGQLDDARRHFQQALDTDGHPVRATQPYCSSVAEVGAAFSIPVVFTGAALRPHTESGILDRSLFHDNVHPTLRGFYYMGLAGADVLQQSRMLEPRFGPPKAIPAAEFVDAVKAMSIGRDDVALALRRSANGLRWLGRLRFEPARRIQQADEYERLAKLLESGEIDPGEEGIESLR